MLSLGKAGKLESLIFARRINGGGLMVIGNRRWSSLHWSAGICCFWRCVLGLKGLMRGLILLRFPRPLQFYRWKKVSSPWCFERDEKLHEKHNIFKVLT